MREVTKIPEIEPSSVGYPAAPLEPPMREPREVDLLDLLLVLVQRKKTILLLTVSAGVLAAIVSLLLPKMYTATTTILPPQQNESSARVLLGQIGILGGLSGGDLGLSNPDDLFIAMLRSRTLQDGIIDRFDLRRIYGVKRYQDARKKLNGRSEIMAEREGLISVGVSDNDPKRAADMANAYVDLLRSFNQSLAVSEAGQRRLFYQEKIQEEKEALSQAELALQQVQEKSGLIQPEAQGKAIIEAVANARAQVAMQEVRVQAMRTYATADNPDLKRAEQELGGMRAQLAKLERNTGETGNGNLAVTTRNLPEAQLEYLRRMRDVKYHEAVYEFLGKQLEAARIDEAKEAVVVQVVDKAVQPEESSSPRRTLIVLATAVIAFIFSCLYVLVSQAMKRKRPEVDGIDRMASLREHLGFSRSDS